MVLIIIPIAAWSKHGTGITWSGLWSASKAPLFAGLLAGSVGLISEESSSAARRRRSRLLALEFALVLAVYASALLAMGQKKLYVDLLSELFRRARPRDTLTGKILRARSRDHDSQPVPSCRAATSHALSAELLRTEQD